MGGIGSGRYADFPSPVLDDLPRFNIDHFAREHGLGETVDQEYELSTGGAIAVTTTPDAIRFACFAPTRREPDRSISSVHRLEKTPCTKGGIRGRLTCGHLGAQGRCQNQCRVLYFHDGHPMCRRCCGLPYRSQQHDPGGSAFAHLHRLRARLGASPSAGELVPPRPRFMHHRTYLALRGEIMAVFQRIEETEQKVCWRLLNRQHQIQLRAANHQMK